MFEEKVSIFESFYSEPKIITLGQWLKVCKEGSRFTRQVLEYRRCLNELIDKGYSLDEAKAELENNGKEKLKKSLPLVTVGAVCEGGRKLMNVTTRTGWIALDVDGKDNPHIKDAAALRDEIAKIVYVAFSGLSTGGNGVWGLVKVKHPERQAEHFEQLIKDFASRGIILDSSKGRNPNDARFYSYDPGAIVKDSFKIYERLPTSSKCSPFTTHRKMNGNTSDVTLNYGKKALENEINILSSAPKGNRNNQLFKSSASLASLVAGGVLEEHTVKDHLFDAARATGLKESEIRNTLQSGFKTGLQSPRAPDPNGHNRSMVSPSPDRDGAGERKIQSRNSAPNGFNPFTGEIFDKRGYPANWDEIEAPEPGSPEDMDAIRHVVNDADAPELQKLMDADPMLAEIVKTFDCELI